MGVDSNGCEVMNCILGVKELQLPAAEITVFPNPTTGVLNFKYPMQDNVTTRLADMAGRTIDQQVLQNSSSAVFDVSKYTPGVYLYEVNAGGKRQTGKVIIE